MESKIHFLSHLNVLAMTRLPKRGIISSLGTLPTVNLLLVLLGAVFALLAIHLFKTWARLKHIPGPFPACITNFQRVWWVQTQRAHLIHQDVHEKYGEIVRTGPNTVLVSNPDAIPQIYPMRPGFIKGDFYASLRPYTRGTGALQVVFNTQDEKLHKQIKNPIAPIFSASSAGKCEGLIDDVLVRLSERLDERFATKGEIFDLGQWVQFFAFDVMGTMTFSKGYGFIDQGEDVGGMLQMIQNFMERVAPYTQIHWLDKVMNKNMVAHSLKNAPGLSILKFVADTIQDRRNKIANGEEATWEIEGKKDFLSRYIEIQDSNPDLPPWATTAWVFSNVIAGSDSVGTVMRTTLFNLLAHPHTLQKLYEELRDANLSMPYPQYNEVRELPYLEACVQEGIRMHPPFALPFERIVPEGGVEVLGHHLPGGTVVGGSPYVVNRHKGTFGQDAEFWRPERWLVEPEQKKKLENSMLTFGAGRRICLGKHVGILEIKKILPFLIMNYDMHIIDPKAFKVQNSWFFFQKGLHVRISKRPEASEAA